MRFRLQNAVLFLALVAAQASTAFGDPTPAPETEIPLTSSALTYAVNFARSNPNVTVDQKKAVAQKAFEFIREKAAKGLDLKSPDDLYKEFASNPKLMKSWNKTSDGKKIKDPQLGRLISEFNLLINQLNMEKTLGNCKDFKRNLGPTLMEGTCSVCGCREGFGWDSNVYLTWKAKEKQKQKPGKNKKPTEPPKYKEYKGWMPGFAFGKNIQELIAVGDLSTYFASHAREGDPFAPPLDVLKSKRPDLKKPEDLASFAMMSEFRENVYKRAMMSGIQSELSNEVQFSDKYLGKTPDEISTLVQKRVDDEITKQCQHCSLSATFDRDIREKLKNIMKSEIQSGSTMPYDSKTVSAQLCKDLKEAKYVFDAEYDEGVRKAYLDANGGNEPKGGLHNTQFDNASNASSSQKFHYDRERRKVLSSIVQSSAAGKLMLTKAMTSLNGTNPGKTKLKCTPGSEIEDAALIIGAQAETYEAGTKFTTKLNENVHPHDYSLKTFNDDLIALLKMAPHPFGQAVMLSSSTGAAAKFACDLIQTVSDQDLADAYLDDALIWGTVGLTVLSLGTLAPLSMAGLAVNAAIGTTAATVSLVQANAAHKNANNYRTWSIAQDFDPYLRQMSQKEYDRYNALITSAVIGYGFTVLDLNALVMKFVSKGDTVTVALAKTEELTKGPPKKLYTEVLTTEAEVAIGGGRVVSKKEANALYQSVHANDVQAARTILKEAGFTESEIPKILAKRIKEESEIIVEKTVVKELDEVVVTTPSKFGSENYLGTSSAHIREADYLATSYFPKKDTRFSIIDVRTGKTVVVQPDVKKWVQIQTRSSKGSPIREVYLLDDSGNVIGKIPCSRSTIESCLNGSDGSVLFDIPIEPPKEVKFVFEDGSEFRWKSKGSGQHTELPDNLKYVMTPSAGARGMSGGHTATSWKKTLELYPDEVKVLSEAKTSVRFPGVDRPIDVSFYRYSILDKEVKLPKTILNVTESELNKIENFISAEYKRLRPDKVPDHKSFKIQLEDGNEIILRLKDNGDVSTWILNSTKPKIPVPAQPQL